jgi:hypothetical protein
MKLSQLFILGLSLSTSIIWADASSSESAALWDHLKAQELTLDQLKQQLAASEAKVELLADRLDGANQEGGWWQDTQLGGYGELHYNGGETDRVDFHRMVLFLSHRFTDQWRLFSEVELEHSLAGDGAKGEVELEQAYLEYSPSESLHVIGGLFLLPVGFMNETHEPVSFYGVERNSVESKIIPTTWWEAGIGLNGSIGDRLKYHLAYHSGLSVEVTGGKAYDLRGGRQKVSEAPAKDGAVTARLQWNPFSTLNLGVSAQYQNDISQGNGVEKNDAFLSVLTADYTLGGFAVKGLFARWDIEGSVPKSLGKDVQLGWYLESAYKQTFERAALGAFVRYSEWDNSVNAPTDSRRSEVTIGFNYWPIEEIVIKVDHQWIDQRSGLADLNAVNLGLGFIY